MIKTFRLSEVDCPVCAGKMQDLIAAIDGVKMARIDFARNSSKLLFVIFLPPFVPLMMQSSRQLCNWNTGIFCKLEQELMDKFCLCAVEFKL